MFSFSEKGKISKSSVDWFLAIYEGEYDNLRSCITMYKIDDKRMPSNMLPIAHDPGGNLICISCAGDDFGRVYFWDHENEVNYGKASDQDYSNLYLVADNFRGFIEGLK